MRKFAFVIVLLVASSVRITQAAGVMPFPQCGAHLTASLVLDHDLTNCPLDGLVVDVDNITVDLNGHTVDGNGTNDQGGIETGIQVGAHSGVTVRNGTVSDFEENIRGDGSHTTVARVNVFNSTTSGIALTGDHGVVHSATVSFSGTNGIVGSGTGPFTVTDSRAIQNFGAGISLFGGGTNTATGSLAYKNEGAGFNISGPNIAVNNDTAQFNGDNGFEFSGSHPHASGNVAEDNQGTGFNGSTANAGTYSNNSASRNELGGFYLTGTGANTFSGNVAKDNLNRGIVIGGDGSTLTNNVATGSLYLNEGFLWGGGNNQVLTGNRSSNNQGDGFNWGGTGTVFRKNIASSNGGDGFQVQGVKSLTGNKSFNNVYEGIKIVSGDGIVVKKNKSHDNGYNGIRFVAGDGDRAIKNVTNHNGFANGEPDGFGDGIFVESGVTNFFGKGNKAKNNDDQFQCSAIAHCTP